MSRNLADVEVSEGSRAAEIVGVTTAYLIHS